MYEAMPSGASGAPAKAAIAGAKKKLDADVKKCAAQRTEAGRQYARYTADLAELAQIADPETRAGMTGHDIAAEAADVAAAASAAAAPPTTSAPTAELQVSAISTSIDARSGAFQNIGRDLQDSRSCTAPA